MDISDYTKQQGTFLKAEDVAKNPSLHLPIKNGEDVRIFDCSKTNSRFIEEKLQTSDTKVWVGKFLVLETYRTKTSDGKLVDAINVKEVK